MGYLPDEADGSEVRRGQNPFDNELSGREGLASLQLSALSDERRSDRCVPFRSPGLLPPPPKWTGRSTVASNGTGATFTTGDTEDKSLAQDLDEFKAPFIDVPGSPHLR